MWSLWILIIRFKKQAANYLLAAGHHATERYGAKTLGEHLADEFC